MWSPEWVGKREEVQNRIVIEHQIAGWSCAMHLSMRHSQTSSVDSQFHTSTCHNFQQVILDPSHPEFPHPVFNSCLLFTGIPVSQVSMEIQSPGDWGIEGQSLVLVCSVAKGTGLIMYSWHREDTKESVGRKSQHSQRAELEIAPVRESHAGGYYCTADNSYGLVQSAVVTVTVKGKQHSQSGASNAQLGMLEDGTKYTRQEEAGKGSEHSRLFVLMGVKVSTVAEELKEGTEMELEADCGV